jgi:hypothetical protein
MTKFKKFSKKPRYKKVWYVAFRYYYNNATNKMQEFQYRNEINGEQISL